ncbi:TPA: hypothetical protein ACIZB4_001202 [Legionella pneumophila]|uniref:Uncharacterized protein n=3 Tax=Legionella TaxID=445 RepID=A0A128MF99_LEGPN|nr:hypothetical protein [Legionella pneumophila]SQG89907.1 Uncharacterised protein [Legionella pneumophila subsp. pascullei]STX43360.1 Uncharacterised protein [Legionella gratiana]MCW8438499.1 hypothetical protein [Legionella pneumophila]MCW8480920.1 hypothetical protein [Legionella pneumophila]MCW8491255.1 hypothetical protein [Legionella pneumophila]
MRLLKQEDWGRYSVSHASIGMNCLRCRTSLAPGAYFYSQCGKS